MGIRISKAAATVVMAAGLTAIGGSIVGGLALAADHGRDPVAGIDGTTVSDEAETASTGTAEAEDVDSASDDVSSGSEDESGTSGRSPGESRDDCDDACATAKPSPSPSPDHDDDDPEHDD